MQFAAALGPSKLPFPQCYVIVVNFGFKVAQYAQFLSSGQTMISQIRQKKKFSVKVLSVVFLLPSSRGC